MKFNFRHISVLAAAVATLTLSSCEEEVVFNIPAVTQPEAASTVTGSSIDISFPFTAEAGFQSASVAATNGTATIKTSGTVGSTSGTVVVSYTAGTTVGAGAVTLTVTDAEGRASNSTAVITVAAEQKEFVISSNITTNTTWKTGNTYILASRVTVTAGNTLTIEPGVIVKGQAGTGANATALIIARGAKINAAGTAEKPIIFTSVADEIKPGEIKSPNLEPTLSGLWGGLIVLGNAPVSAVSESVQIEGIPASDQNGLYGGTNAADNSGVIKYVSIRHGGANIGEGNEINGLTLGGVGSGTVIENIEVVANQDDGIEWFGGTVSVKNALVWNAGDDALDTDQAWSGTLDNFIVICGETDHSLEIDGPEGALLAGHTVKNGSIKGSSVAELGDFRASARGTFENIYFFNFPSPATSGGRGDFSLSSGSDVTFANGDLKFNNLEITLVTGTTLTEVFRNGTSVHAKAVTTRTTGATVAAFNGWSYASANGALTGF